MPLKHPLPVGLKKLKKIIGHKGESFAKLIGVPYDTLKSIESGRLKMSEEVTQKIRLATGITAKSIFKKTPQPILRGEYNENFFHFWRNRFLSLGKDKTEARADAEKKAQYIGFFTKVLLLAAVEDGKAATYGTLHIQIASLIRDLAEKHDLGPMINKELLRFPIEDVSPEWTKAEWLAMPQIRSSFKVTDKDLRRLGDYATHKAKRTLYPAWSPEGGVVEQALKPQA